MKKALSFDIGGTKINFAIIDENGNAVNDIQKINTPSTKEDIYNSLKNIVNKYENEVDMITIATAGAVNNENTRILSSTGNLPVGYNEIDFQSLSENKKVVVENDANCSVWAEYKLGSGKDCGENIVLLTLGTGVGGGIIVNGKLLKGKSGSAGEMHFTIKEKQRPCTCGFHDCYEAYASGNGLKNTAREIYNDNTITTYDVIEGAGKNDERAINALNEWQQDVAFGIIGLINIFDPNCVILSGSMAQFIDYEKMNNFVNNNIVVQKTEIKKGYFDNNSGIIGAALFGLDKLKGENRK